MSAQIQEKDSQFIYADDLIIKGVWSEVKIKIAEVVPPGGLTYANKRSSTKYALKFEGKGKHWEMPTTQFRLLKMGLGRDLNKWKGKSITLYPAWGKTPFGKGPFIRSRPLCPVYTVPGGIQQHMGKDLTGKKLTQENE
tara:strand:+ start:762 stop:1178 length:417 start_codon:yes stop_codon:yes gene_type:complete